MGDCTARRHPNVKWLLAGLTLDDKAKLQRYQAIMSGKVIKTNLENFEPVKAIYCSPMSDNTKKWGTAKQVPQIRLWITINRRLISWSHGPRRSASNSIEALDKLTETFAECLIYLIQRNYSPLQSDDRAEHERLHTNCEHLGQQCHKSQIIPVATLDYTWHWISSISGRPYL